MLDVEFWLLALWMFLTQDVTRWCISWFSCHSNRSPCFSRLRRGRRSSAPRQLAFRPRGLLRVKVRKAGSIANLARVVKHVQDVHSEFMNARSQSSLEYLTDIFLCWRVEVAFLIDAVQHQDQDVEEFHPFVVLMRELHDEFQRCGSSVCWQSFALIAHCAPW